VLPLARATDPSTLIAYEMNGTQLPLLNGFPLRAVVSGWYATYWVKMLTEITVTTHPGTGFWMNPAYTIPDTPNGSMTPGQTGVKMVPINAMDPRSFFTSLVSGNTLHMGKPMRLEGFAFGGGSALKEVSVSADGGGTWQAAALGKDWGAYGSRAWSLAFDGGWLEPRRLPVQRDRACRCPCCLIPSPCPGDTACPAVSPASCWPPPLVRAPSRSPPLRLCGTPPAWCCPIRGRISRVRGRRC